MALTLLRYGYDTMMVNLEEAVYVNHVVNGLEHPDMKKWRESIERDEERVRGAKNALSIGNISGHQIKDGLENLFKRMNETKKLNELYSKGFKVGRNDPCPCGSGKKYKKCCGK
ncbi:MAG: SEC-C metal-binding domain-containing protein [Firmicutes bacterium]|nr:SEC-C metal-binding domain-containing protein [Bacillota bacterium]